MSDFERIIDELDERERRIALNARITSLKDKRDDLTEHITDLEFERDHPDVVEARHKEIYGFKKQHFIPVVGIVAYTHQVDKESDFGSKHTPEDRLVVSKFSEFFGHAVIIAYNIAIAGGAYLLYETIQKGLAK
jgi:hypothetical protein